MIDFYKLINENGFNGITAINIGCLLALSLEKSDEDFTKDCNAVKKAVDKYCELHSLSEETKNDFLNEVNEYTLK